MATRGTQDQDIWFLHTGSDLSEDGFDIVGVIDGGRKGVDLGGGVCLCDFLLGFLQQLGSARQNDDVGRSRSCESCNYSLADALTPACN